MLTTIGRLGSTRGRVQVMFGGELPDVRVLLMLRQPLRAPENQSLPLPGNIDILLGLPVSLIGIEKIEFGGRRFLLRAEERVVADERELPLFVVRRDVLAECVPVGVVFLTGLGPDSLLPDFDADPVSRAHI